MMALHERKHTRIDLTLLADITIYNNPNRFFLVKNISVSGIFIATHLKIVTGTKCLIELNNTWSDELLDREISGRVARQSDDGFGIQFTQMEVDTYMNLQTRLLYSCRNPVVLAEEFSVSCPVAIKDRNGFFGIPVPRLTDCC